MFVLLSNTRLKILIQETWKLLVITQLLMVTLMIVSLTMIQFTMMIPLLVIMVSYIFLFQAQNMPVVFHDFKFPNKVLIKVILKNHVSG